MEFVAAILDLIDETGALSNLSEKSNLTDYASQYLEGRRKYILIKVISKCLELIQLLEASFKFRLFSLTYCLDVMLPNVAKINLNFKAWLFQSKKIGISFVLGPFYTGDSWSYDQIGRTTSWI